VFAVPGLIDAPTSRGTHALLKQGAKLTETVDDILEELVPQIQRQPCDKSAAPEIELSSDEQTVYAAVTRDPRSIDEVTDHSALTSSTVACALLALELKDAIRQTPGRRYYRSR
jgi:DNA processing protein